MKVTQQSEPKFIPVVITLETQEEVDVLISLVGSVTGSGAIRKWSQDLYDKLHPHSCDVSGRISKYFTGNIQCTYIKS